LWSLSQLVQTLGAFQLETAGQRLPAWAGRVQGLKCYHHCHHHHGHYVSAAMIMVAIHLLPPRSQYPHVSAMLQARQGFRPMLRGRDPACIMHRPKEQGQKVHVAPWPERWPTFP
jgi:hypothetical protein